MRLDFHSGMAEIPEFQTNRNLVMPAQAGIHLRFHSKAKENLDAGLRRHDEKKIRQPINLCKN